MKINVKLAERIERKGSGFADNESGAYIHKGKYNKSGFMEVEKTVFVEYLLEKRLLVEVGVVKKSKTEADPQLQDAEEPEQLIVYTVLKRFRFGGDSYKRGDEIKLTEQEAVKYLNANKIEKK